MVPMVIHKSVVLPDNARRQERNHCGRDDLDRLDPLVILLGLRAFRVVLADLVVQAGAHRAGSIVGDGRSTHGCPL